ERIAGQSWSRRADVFSLAALTHEMLWGRRVRAFGEQAVETLTELPGGDLVQLRRVFTRALAEDPARRFETAMDFAAALREAFPRVTVVPPEPPSVSERPIRPPDIEPPLPFGHPERTLDSLRIVSDLPHA